MTNRNSLNPSPPAGEGGTRRDSGGRVRGEEKKLACGTPSSVKSANAALPPSPARGEEKLRQFAKQMRVEMTLAERRLWYALKNRQLTGYKFRRQVPIGNFIVDFVCFELSVIIEVDGGHHNENTYDEKRDAWLKSQGFRVVRFWNSDVLENIDGVCTHIISILEALKETRDD